MKMYELFEAEDMTIDRVIELIKRDCKPYLSAAPHDWLLFRGTRKGTSPGKHSVRSDRQPRDTDKDLHVALDKWFFDKFGAKARSQAIFVTGHSEIASSYGSLCAVFPIGDFKYIWSPVVDDLSALIEKRNPEDIPEIMDNGEYQDTDLPGAVHSENEVMIVCKEYYVIPVSGANNIDDLLAKIFEK